MKVAVFGLGYVGFTAMCCIATEGHVVVGFDVSEKKVLGIRSGQPPIIEDGLEELLQAGLAKGLISAHTKIGNRLDDIDLAIVCVGTPSAPDGSHNMTYIAEVSRQIATALKSGCRNAPLVVAYRSTIRPGSIEGLIAPIFRAELGSDFDSLVDIVYHPEFLREGSAVQDYFNPPKIVVGTSNGQPNECLAELNRNIVAPTFVVDYGEAEITKFVDNTWHAVKVAFANEVGRVCLQLGLSASTVSEIFLSDTKLNISSYYLRPGGAFGGSCLPKDVRAFQYIADDCGAHTHLVNSLLRSNDEHKTRLYQHAAKGLKPGAKILLVGLAFKAHTDDLRESPNVDIARAFLRDGFALEVFDPAIDAKKLVGANLGYAYTQIPTLSKLLVDKATAETNPYDRIVVTNATSKLLDLSGKENIVDIGQLA
ncbi:nucleotide sugar dehydrogenase [Rhizobium oryzicola]|uniref:UDP-glucose 6-dehydrogenase n=1 Tax=Rhizobium oryzicola TaxID=1232668 RepID=A0ABT8SWH2_9HYPH|nr:nucleotide sugar dehydrogenase [Rhizobium oryzicola]MDO1582790.1 nucleotide sugar dehydrogenase [Rhizobium oryzicola]